MRLLQIFPATNALDYFPKNVSSHRAFSGLSNAVTETSASTGVLRQYVFNALGLVFASRTKKMKFHQIFVFFGDDREFLVLSKSVPTEARA